MFRVWVRGYLLDSGRRSRRQKSTGARVDNNFRVENARYMFYTVHVPKYSYYVVQVLLPAVGTGEMWMECAPPRHTPLPARTVHGRTGDQVSR